MSRSFQGEAKVEAKRNHHNRQVEDTFQWLQVKAQFMMDPARPVIRPKVRKVS